MCTIGATCLQSLTTEASVKHHVDYIYFQVYIYPTMKKNIEASNPERWGRSERAHALGESLV